MTEFSKWPEIAKFGRKLVERGLVESTLGNISVRFAERMLITRSGAALDEITGESVVELDIDNPSDLDAIASKESSVHRAIYRKTPALAIIHAHCPFAVIESMLVEKIVPVDIEGQYFLHEIPVVRGGAGTQELAESVSEALKGHRGAVVFGHGTFAVGKTLEEAYVVTALIEHTCKVKYYFDVARK